MSHDYSAIGRADCPYCGRSVGVRIGYVSKRPEFVGHQERKHGGRCGGTGTMTPEAYREYCAVAQAHIAPPPPLW